jgi:hypothetical protein
MHSSKVFYSVSPHLRSVIGGPSYCPTATCHMPHGLDKARRLINDDVVSIMSPGALKQGFSECRGPALATPNSAGGSKPSS